MKKQIVIDLVKRVNELDNKVLELEDIFDNEKFYRMKQDDLKKVDLETYLFKCEVGSSDCVLSTNEILSAIAYIMNIDIELLGDNKELETDYDKFMNLGYETDDKPYNYERYYNDLIELSKLYPIK